MIYLISALWCTPGISFDCFSEEEKQHERFMQHRGYFHPLSPTFVHFINFYPHLSRFTHFHPFSSTFIRFRPLLSTFAHFHPFYTLSPTFTHFHPLSSTFYPLSHPPALVCLGLFQITVLKAETYIKWMDWDGMDGNL